MALAQKRVPSLRTRQPSDSNRPSRAAGDFEPPPRKTVRFVLVGEEGGIMLADDLGFFIALEAARAGIPGGDIALRIQHVDCVIGDGIDEELKTLLPAMILEPFGLGHRHPGKW